MFLGYAQDNVVYRYLVLHDEGILFEANTIFKFKNAEFLEHVFP